MMLKKHGVGLITLGFWGILVVILYANLFTYEEQILHLSTQGGWACVVPVVIAFVFSVAHGNFTAYFWDSFGIKAKTRGGNK